MDEAPVKDARILVVGARPDEGRALVEVLEREGYAAVRAVASSEALPACRELGQDLIVLDLDAGEIDALAALERFDELERENEELLDELELIGIALLAEERLGAPTPHEGLIPVEQLVRKHGFAGLLGE